MSKVFKPRRGKASTLATKNPTLEAGEIIVEVPDTGVGTGTGKVKMGDGTTPYNSLPTLLGGELGSQTSDVSSDSSTTVAAALNNVVSGSAASNLFGSLKQAAALLNTKVTELNDDILSFQTGVTNLYNEFINKGVTPASTSLAAMKAAVTTLYNKGKSDGVTVHSTTYSLSTKASAAASTYDMGASHSYRYINATAAWNKASSTGYASGTAAGHHTTTYTMTSSEKTKDLGAAHQYRYINANNVYNAGSNSSHHSTTYTMTSSEKTKDLGGAHNYRYINANNVYNSGTGTGYNNGTAAIKNEIGNTTSPSALNESVLGHYDNYTQTASYTATGNKTVLAVAVVGSGAANVGTVSNVTANTFINSTGTQLAKWTHSANKKWTFSEETYWGSTLFVIGIFRLTSGKTVNVSARTAAGYGWAYAGVLSL